MTVFYLNILDIWQRFIYFGYIILYINLIIIGFVFVSNQYVVLICLVLSFPLE